MVRVSNSGRINQLIQENGKMVSNMGMVKKLIKNRIIHILAIGKMDLSKRMGKKDGLMVHITRVIG